MELSNKIKVLQLSFLTKVRKNKQGGQEVLNHSPKFCLKLTNRYLLKADHVPGDTWGRAIYGPRGII